MNERSNRPSITRIDTQPATLQAFRVDGKITRPDIEWMASVLTAAFEAWDEVDVLIVMASWQGIEVGAAFDPKALSAQARSVRHVRRYAVVGAPGWAEAMINLSSPLSPVEARTFDRGDEAAAWAWVRSV